MLCLQTVWLSLYMHVNMSQLDYKGMFMCLGMFSSLDVGLGSSGFPAKPLSQTLPCWISALCAVVYLHSGPVELNVVKSLLVPAQLALQFFDADGFLSQSVQLVPVGPSGPGIRQQLVTLQGGWQPNIEHQYIETYSHEKY